MRFRGLTSILPSTSLSIISAARRSRGALRGGWLSLVYAARSRIAARLSWLALVDLAAQRSGLSAIVEPRPDDVSELVNLGGGPLSAAISQRSKTAPTQTKFAKLCRRLS
jgi:hypothetical protein